MQAITEDPSSDGSDRSTPLFQLFSFSELSAYWCWPHTSFPTYSTNPIVYFTDILPMSFKDI